MTTVIVVIAVVPMIAAGIAPVAPGLPILCIQVSGLLTPEGLELVGIAALFRKALRGAVVTLLATFEQVAAFPVVFGIGLTQVRLATLPLFDTLGAAFALRHYLGDALLARLSLLQSVGVVAALLPSQFTCNLPLRLLTHFLPGLLALLVLLLSWLLSLLLRLPFALLLAQFLARAEVIFVLGGILRAGEGI